MTYSHISIEGLGKSFPPPQGKGEPVVVFDDLWLRIEKGEFVCVIGHSGCGKTTLLNILAGLDSATTGAYIVDGKEADEPSLDRAVVFQSHALLPWMTVNQNVALAVSSRWPGWKRARVLEHCRRYIDLVHLSSAGSKKPAELSGGMKQRVGIARALSIEPKMLLLDEPFSALDALTRGSLQDELLRICEASGQTVFMITHDVDEALLLADKIVLMTNGPNAKISEVVVNTLPRERTRLNMHKHPHYYRIRNHLIDFLVSRSAKFAEEMKDGEYDPRHPPLTRPGLQERPVSESDSSPGPAECEAAEALVVAG